MSKTKALIVAVAMLLLGIAMIVIGAMGSLLPPVLTGVGFVVLAWAFLGPTTSRYA